MNLVTNTHTAAPPNTTYRIPGKSGFFLGLVHVTGTGKHFSLPSSTTPVHRGLPIHIYGRRVVVTIRAAVPARLALNAGTTHARYLRKVATILAIDIAERNQLHHSVVIHAMERAFTPKS